MAVAGEQSLAERGLRLTPQRLMILEAIQSRDDHFSAEEIYAQVRQRYSHMNLSTVYRTLELLSGAGLVTATDLGDGRVRYHWAEKSRHHHLICQNCGKVIDLEERLLAPLQAILRRDYAFEANFAHLTIFGRCARCDQAESAAAPT